MLADVGERGRDFVLFLVFGFYFWVLVEGAENDIADC